MAAAGRGQGTDAAAAGGAAVSGPPRRRCEGQAGNQRTVARGLNGGMWPAQQQQCVGRGSSRGPFHAPRHASLPVCSSHWPVTLRCSDSVKAHVTAGGRSIVSDGELRKDPVALVQALVDLRDKFARVVDVAFSDDKDFQRALKEVRCAARCRGAVSRGVAGEGREGGGDRASGSVQAGPPSCTPPPPSCPACLATVSPPPRRPPSLCRPSSRWSTTPRASERRGPRVRAPTCAPSSCQSTSTSTCGGSSRARRRRRSMRSSTRCGAAAREERAGFVGFQSLPTVTHVHCTDRVHLLCAPPPPSRSSSSSASCTTRTSSRPSTRRTCRSGCWVSTAAPWAPPAPAESACTASL
jgi:hypothetical protein